MHIRRLVPLVLLGLSLPLVHFVTPAAASQPASPYAADIKALHATILLLEKADHDYQGHRVKAMHDIHAAIKVLHPAHKAAGKSTGAPKPGQGQGSNETQDVSDAQLKLAAQQLATVATALANDKSTPATLAVAEIQKAIEELNTALKIK